MLTRMFLLLFWVFSLLSSTFNYHIDYSRCYTDMKCAVRESCIQGKPATANQTLTYLSAPQKLIDECDVIVQIRSFTRKKYLMMIQINASKSTKDLTDQGAEISQGSIKLKCEKKGVTGDAAFDIKTLEAKHADNVLFCSFIIRSVDDRKIEDNFENDLNFPILKFVSDSPQEIKFHSIGPDFWRYGETATNCNPEHLLSENVPDSQYRVVQLDTTLSPPLTCNPSENLRIVNNAGVTEFLEKGVTIECETKLWKYKNGSALTVVNSAITAHCVEKFCTLCDSLEQINCGAACSTPSNGTESDICKPRAGSACPNNQWVVDGDNVVIVKSITCEKDKDDRENRKAAWYVDVEGSSERVKVTKAVCYDKSICWTAARLEEKCDKVDTTIMECTSFNRSSDDTKIYCADGFTLMHSFGDVISTETTQLTCNFQTGNFNDGNSTEIKRGTTVYCGRQKERVVEQQAAEAGFDPMIGAVVGGLILLIIIAVIVVVVFRRRKKGSEPKGAEKVGETSAQPTQSTPEPPPAPPAKTRDPWLGRERFLLPVIKKNTRITGRMTRLEKGEVYLKEFVHYDFLHRQEIFYSTFCSIDAVNLTLFWRFFKMFEQRNFDCMAMWEMTWRIIRTFDGKLMEADKDDGNLYLAMHERIRNRMIRFALPILTELGWKIRPGELPVDTWMRLFVVRVLLWAEEPSVCKELCEQANLPIDKLESPLRAAVFQYAVRHMNRTEELYKKYWMSHVIGDPVDAAADKFGTIRQHLLYGFATNDDKATLERHEKTKKEDNDERPLLTADTVLTVVSPDDICKTFTPHDGYWGYLGATEYYTSVDSTIALFSDSIVGTPESRRSKRDKRSNDKMFEFAAIRERQLNEKCKDMTPEQKEAVKKSWMKWSIASICMMAELCTTQKQEDLLADPILVFKYYCAKLPTQPKIIYDTQMLRELTRNWTGHITGKKEDVFRSLEYHFKQCED